MCTQIKFLNFSEMFYYNYYKKKLDISNGKKQGIGKEVILT